MYEIRAVVTHYYEPDMKIKRPLFQKYVDICEEYSIPLIIVNKNQETLELLKEIDHHFLVCNCYKYIIPDEYLCADFASLNMHRSLLPKYKGLKPLKRALENNEKEAGITVHEMTDELDSGNILCQLKIDIDEKDTEKSLFEKLYPIQYTAMHIAITKYFAGGYYIE